MTLNKNKAGWDLLGDHTYQDFNIFSIKRSTRRNPRTSAVFDFFRIDGLDWANVIALTDQQEIVLVRQYRHGIEDYTLELPGGCVESSELDAKQAVLRELEEETGYRATHTQFLGKVRPNPAMMSNTCTLYVATGCKFATEQKLDSGENIDVVLIPLADAFELIRNDNFPHALHVAAFALLMLHAKKLGVTLP